MQHVPVMGCWRKALAQLFYSGSIQKLLVLARRQGALRCLNLYRAIPRRGAGPRGQVSQECNTSRVHGVEALLCHDNESASGTMAGESGTSLSNHGWPMELSLSPCSLGLTKYGMMSTWSGSRALDDKGSGSKARHEGFTDGRWPSSAGSCT